MSPTFVSGPAVKRYRLVIKLTTWVPFPASLQKFLFEDTCLRVQELCESRGGRPGLPVLMSLMVSVDVKQH